jgi:hypothetical protein
VHTDVGIEEEHHIAGGGFSAQITRESGASPAYAPEQLNGKQGGDILDIFRRSIVHDNDLVWQITSGEQRSQTAM